VVVVVVVDGRLVQAAAASRSKTKKTKAAR
jgi:hypothetical protein